MAVLKIETDADIDTALRQLGDTFGDTTSTIKVARQRLADQQRREMLRRAALAAAADPADVAEMRSVMADMDEISVW